MKRFELGVLDVYPIAVMGTAIEDSPTVGVTLDEKVDGVRLEKALLKAVELFPLFKTKIVFDKGYFLEENDKPILVFNENDYDKTFTWKTGTNDYPWKLSYFENRILLRWCHGITDGRCAERFLGTLLNLYYGNDVDIKPELELGLEPFFNKNEKGIPQRKQGPGFGKKAFKVDNSKNKVLCHVLKCRTKDLLMLSKRSDASPATIIPPLFSKALRACMDKKMDVKTGVVVDARAPLNHKTMHNCIFAKGITYVDRFDAMDFELVSTIYRAILILAVERENVVTEATNSVSMIGAIVNNKVKWLIKLGGKLCAAFMKDTSSDVTFSYLGKIDYGEEVNKHIKDYTFCSWTDFGYCNIGATDFDGTFTLMINEAFENKDIIPQFINISKSLGLDIKEVDSYPYYRADM
ncbi:MAG: hypothetical protein Q4F55_02535 [Bacillota bacterium]|nr:hypothetical protein [Bacillota bacterium]